MVPYLYKYKSNINRIATTIGIVTDFYFTAYNENISLWV